MSHLPLLFAEGQPTCLEHITQAQLERFIPFMVNCCPSSKTTVPSWWPKELKFSFPLKSPPLLRSHWLQTLKNIVRKCYQHYDCTYVLDFCRKLALLGNRNLYYRETGDRTEVIERSTNRLLVSVKSKNKTYDLVPPSPKKQLLLRPLPSKPPPIIDDIYLCSYCDAEFTSSRDIEEHERTEHPPKVEEQISPKERHLRSLGLTLVKAEKSNEVKTAVRARRITSNLTFKKVGSIPICTPLGKLLLANTPTLTKDEARRAQVKVEQYCSTTDKVALTSESNGVRRSRRVPGTLQTRNKLVWAHQYTFNRQQKAERMETIRTGLDRESRRLLRHCKPCKTVVRRLPGLPGNSTINLRRMKDFIAEEFPNQCILEPPKPVLPPAPPTPPTPVEAAPLPLAQRLLQFGLGDPIPGMYAAFNSRPPLAGVPSNRLPTFADANANRNPVKLHKMLTLVPGTSLQRAPGTPVQRTPVQGTSVQRTPLQGTSVQRTPVQGTSVQRTPVQRTPVQTPVHRITVTPVPKATPIDPEIIDLCSSDEEECEVVTIPIAEKTETYVPIVTTPKYGVTAACPKESCHTVDVDETEMAGIPAKDNNTVLYVQQLVRSRS